MFKKQEPVVTMTADELAALVDARIAEREAAARRAIEEAQKPKPEPRQPEPGKHYQTQPSPELTSLLLEVFDAAGTQGFRGDDQFTRLFQTLYGITSNGAGGRQVLSIPPDQRAAQLLESWRGCSWIELDWLARLGEQGRVIALIRQLDFQRKNPNHRDEEIAERIRLAKGIAENASYMQEARRPSDLSEAELVALLAAKRAQGAQV